jgi:hypothetical protein
MEAIDGPADSEIPAAKGPIDNGMLLRHATSAPGYMDSRNARSRS